MLLTWPSSANLLTDSLVDLERAQEVITSPYTFLSNTIDKGGVRWRGQVTIAPVGFSGAVNVTAPDPNSPPPTGHKIGFEIETFLQLLSDANNWAEIPLERQPAKIAAVGVAISNSEIVDDIKLRVTAGGTIDDLLSGQYVRIGNRTYRVISKNGSKVDLIPGILPVGTNMSPTSTIRAKITPETSPAGISRTPSQMGPWVVSWEEYLGS